MKGRKRTLIVDTLGLLLDLWVHPADIQDYDAGKEVLEPLRECYPRMKKVWADGQFGKNGLPEWAQEELGLILEIVSTVEPVGTITVKFCFRPGVITTVVSALAEHS